MTAMRATAVGARSAAVLSPRERRYLAEYARHGDYRRVAACVGRSFWTVKGALYGAYRKLDADSAINALWRLGWITLPADLVHAA